MKKRKYACQRGETSLKKKTTLNTKILPFLRNLEKETGSTVQAPLNDLP